jgi:prepilin-type N-terminal cleavage/methylation domain-containing protein
MSSRLEVQKGFTLIEILVVIVIIVVLTMLTFASFTQVQRNARDAQRKGDLQTVAGILQRFYSDNSKYPDSNGGQLNVNGTCATEPGSNIPWGTGSITCTNVEGLSKNYTRALPAEPLPSGPQYCYVRTPTNQRYELHARLEATTGNSYTCNGVNYNYRVTAND